MEEVEGEPVSNEQDFDDDDFLPLFLSACSGVTAMKSCSQSGICKKSNLQCSKFFELCSTFRRNFQKDCYFPFSVKAFFSPRATTILGCCFKNCGKVKKARCHYSRLFCREYSAP